MRLLVEYTSHGRGPAAPQTYTTTLDIVDDVDAVHVPGTEALHAGSSDPCIPDLRHREPAGTELRRQRPDFEHPAG